MSKPSVLLVAVVGASAGALIVHFGDGVIPTKADLSEQAKLLVGIAFGAEFAMKVQSLWEATAKQGEPAEWREKFAV